ncbi:MAG: MotA/TolQ/ExbB proton channel family protein [Kiritimatiellae bacterium]|nr:MotA/TolQ/ExbB proton channel family protein [Kiritimatiellia bacterium]MDW8458081.1 MotA/TolQ/ExbB proton channel family protein [Verrucomicrobiota bacterium]
MNVYLLQGGPVLWAILALSAVIVLLIAQRALFVHRSSLRGRDFLGGIINNLQRGNVMEAIALCEDTPGPIPQMARAAILELQQGGKRIGPVMHDVGVIEIARLEKHLPLLLALAQTAPLLGLIGTCVGMWEMAAALQAQSPLVHAGDLGAGLSRALLTTIAGLSVGAVGWIGHAFIVTRVNAVVLEMERAYLEILQAVAQLAGGSTES